MNLKLYQVDAFAEKLFEGNPAAVIPLKEWLPDPVMQSIAVENNLSETAFFVPEKDGFHLRWFTPASEVNLCGHATLATAHVLFNHLGYNHEVITFNSRSGILKVKKKQDLLQLDFPVSPLMQISLPPEIEKAVGKMPVACYMGREDMMLVFEWEKDIRNAVPDPGYIKTLKARGLIITAPSSEYDFVSRFFAPLEGIDEDPVTGSAHTVLIPYWANRLNKPEMIAKQVSQRGGILHCRLLTDRVEIGGHAITYMTGEINL